MSRTLYRLLIQNEDDAIVVRYVARNGKSSRPILYPSLQTLAIVTGMRLADMEPSLKVRSCWATKEQFEMIGFPSGSERLAFIAKHFCKPQIQGPVLPKA